MLGKVTGTVGTARFWCCSVGSTRGTLGFASFTVMDTCHASFFTFGLMGTIPVLRSSLCTVVKESSSMGMRAVALFGCGCVTEPTTGRISTLGEQIGDGGCGWPVVMEGDVGCCWEGKGVVTGS